MNEFAKIFFVLALVMACEKDDSEPDEANSREFLDFISLTAEEYSIPRVGGSTKITANAIGSGSISYEWRSTYGAIIGSGSQVTFISTCDTCAENYIYCTARMGKFSIEKFVVIIGF